MYKTKFSNVALGLAIVVAFLFIPINDIWTLSIDEDKNLPIELETIATDQKEPQYAAGEILLKVKDGVDPISALQRANIKPEKIKRIKSIKPVVNKFKRTFKLEKGSGSWYWFRGKNYQEVESISDEALFQEAYEQMPPLKQGLYRNYKVDLAEDISVETAVASLSRNPDVEYVEPNYIYSIQDFPQTLPNDTYVDPLGNSTWSIGAWNQTTYEDLWGLKKIKADKAWSITQGLYSEGPNAGEPVIVAVIDTGVDYNHPDIAASMWDDGEGHHGYDFVNDDNDPMDGHGHGTHCSGTITATGNNGIGIIGVAPQAQIMAIKGLDDGGSGYVSDLFDCVTYAVDNGAKVLSNSWGGRGQSQTLEDAFNYAHDNGCISLAAAGNDNTDVKYFHPANIDTVIAVGATNPNDERCSFSNYGDKIDIAAPGGDGKEFDGLDGPISM